MIPYGRHFIDDDDIQSVVEVLKSDWITTGPMVEKFESGVAEYVGVRYAIAVSSGTAALHAVMHVVDIEPGDEVIVPPITFTATANAVVYMQGTPIFCDVEKDTLLIDPNLVVEKITARTKAVVAVDYAGQPCDYDALRDITERHNLILIADACHSLGASYKGRSAGSLADLSVFSFHPVKHITTGEGGMVTTDSSDHAEKLRRFRNHGIFSDYHRRAEKGSWFYEMVELGYNYRITDIQCALGLSQLRKLPAWIERRREIARQYDDAFADLEAVEPLAVNSNALHAYHLYVIRLRVELLGRGFAWLDTGTHESFMQASNFVQTVQDRQGLLIACPEEIAYCSGYISKKELIKLTEPMLKNNYGRYLMKLVQDDGQP